MFRCGECQSFEGDAGRERVVGQARSGKCAKTSQALESSGLAAMECRDPRWFRHIVDEDGATSSEGPICPY
jgi:hypothetical protein